MKTLLKALFASVALSVAGSASAQETLIFATTNPEQHPFNQGFLIPWAERINESANGAVTIDIRHGPTIANHTNFYDRVIDDVVQIVWGLTVQNPGKFSPTLVAALPFTTETPAQGSVAVCRMSEQGAFSPELDDIVPLLWLRFPQATLHLNGGPLTGMEDIEGKRIITTTPAATEIVQAFGGTSLSFGITEMYEALQRGTADGTVINYTAFPGFRLNEVTTDHYTMPMGSAAGVVFMARDKWDSLSEEAQNAIMAHSGCEGSRGLGEFIHNMEVDAKSAVANEDGHTITEASPEEIEAVAAKLAPGIEGAFAGRVTRGAELIEAFKREIAAAKAE